MILDTFMLCDAAEAYGGKLSILGGGITRMTFGEFPGVAPLLTVVVRFRFVEEETEVAAPFSLKGESPTNAEWITIEGNLAGAWPDLAEEEERYLNLVVAFGPVRFTEPGLYRIQLHVADEMIRELALPVVSADS